MKNIEEILQNPNMAQLMLQAFQSLLDNSDAMLFVKDANLVYQAANMPFVHLLNKDRLEDVIGQTDFDVFGDQSLAQRYVTDDKRLFAENKDVISLIEPLPDESGRPRYARTSKYILRQSDGTIIGLAGISRDITREIVANSDHQKEISYLFNLPENAFMAIYIDATDWQIIGERQQDIQKASFRIHENADVLAEKARQYVVDRRGPAYLFYRDFRPDVLQSVYESGRRNITMEYLRRFDDGTERWVRDEINLLVNPTDNHLCLMLTVRDIDERKQEELQLLWAAERDEMTGLLNRASIAKYTKDFLEGEGHLDTHAMFVVDIDNFKQINDTYGHQAGDQFLTYIARSISGCFRDSDFVGRLGGDEFLIVMKYVPNVEIVREKGQNLLAALQKACQPVADLNVSGSIGISLYHQDGDNFERLYEMADQAMYISKRSGKGQLFFASDLLHTELV